MPEHYAHTVTGPLDGLVTAATGYRYAGGPPGVHVGMPSGALTLVVPLDAPLLLTDPAMPEPTPFDGVLAGLSTAPTLVHHDGYQHGVHITLSPCGARAILGMPAAEVAEQSVRLEDALGPVARSLRDQLHDVVTWPGRFAAVERVLMRLMAGHPARRDPAPEVVRAWWVIRAGHGRTPVREVAADVGWSTRHLEARFRAEFGVTPKAVARISRFERSVEAVRDPRRLLSDVAAECGYADQAHLARDWRDLAGCPPSRWRAEDGLAFVQADDEERLAASDG